jgi:2-polyprenyl-3-methyl-5-hydroxy-6-metoxy-1,4-benzoquinol methylase
MEIATRCAVCGTTGNSQEVFPSTVDKSAFTVEVFSARRLPDRRHYRWVRCEGCSLFRSDPVFSVDLTELYVKSTFDYSAELHGLKNSYRRIVEKACSNPLGKYLVEIGGGNGFFLEEALKFGFSKVTEIEPSLHAKEKAPIHLQNNFITDILKENLLPDESVDVAAMFHVLDHLPDPHAALKIVNSLLRPNGQICIAVHNVESISARLLKSKSPIFDVEHTYLYSKKTLRLLLEKAGFKVVEIKHYRNTYSWSYLVHLLPISTSVKKKIIYGRANRILKRLKLTVPLGNIYAIALKP